MSPGQGWYEDPHGSSPDELRWWDGSDWTEDTHSGKAGLPGIHGWYEDPEDPSRERWWDGTAWGEHRRERSGAARGRAQGSDATGSGGFWPFDEPATGDWLFWWAVAVWVLTGVATASRAPLNDGMILDLALALPLNTVLFVLTLGWLRRGWRTGGTVRRALAERSPPHPAGGSKLNGEREWAAGWYPDPHHEGWQRYWSGWSWTSQVRRIGE